MDGTLDFSAKPSQLTVNWAAFVLAATVICGCAGTGGQMPPARRERTTPSESTTPSGSTATYESTATYGQREQVQLRDPLAGIDMSQPVTRTNRGYQNFVTAKLDDLSEFWNRERLVAWNAWADNHLQQGDLIFVQSVGHLILGVIDFSQLTREVTESHFTHMGVVAVENGQTLIYDTVVAGPGRKTFGQMMVLPDVTGVAVKRLRPEFRQHIPAAVEYCRRVYEQQVDFDKKLRLDNDALYCTEMVEVAFRSSGLRLSQPVRWDALPGYDNHPVAINAIRIANQAQPDEYVIIPGNDDLGIWASPALEPVLELTDADSPPGG